MAKPGGNFRKLIWTYDRGTLQYDIICILILLFIFLVPRSCFVSPRSDSSRGMVTRQGTPIQAGVQRYP
jgi:hypothetical protein